MFQTAIGRIQSAIISPPRSLEMQIFLDAGGKAGNRRVWGGLAIIGESELIWVQKVIDEICSEFPIENRNKAEPKGRDIPISIIKRAGQKIRKEDRRILFWANWLPAWNEKVSSDLSIIMTEVLNKLKPNPFHLKKHIIETGYEQNAGYFSKLKDVNKHKLISIMAHIQWIITEISRANMGNQLKSVKIIIDRENFPDEEKCGILVKSFMVAGFQSSGMDYVLTGKAYKEKADEGAIIVNVSGESKDIPGLIFVDILLQAVLRKVETI